MEHQWHRSEGQAVCMVCSLALADYPYSLDRAPKCPGRGYVLSRRRDEPKHASEPVHQDYADYIYGAFTERIMETCREAGISVAEVGTPWNYSLGEPMHEHVWVWINKAGRALSDIQICFLCGQERLMGMTDGLEVEEVKDGNETPTGLS
jgi:hypothetical protein